MRSSPSCYYMIGLISATALFIQIYRKDKRFLSTTGMDTFKIYFSEYTFFSIPLLILIAFSPCWYCLFILPALFAVISLVTFSPNRKIQTLYTLPFIPYTNFEWISGMRKNLWSVLILYLLAFYLFRYPYASLFVLWIMLGIIASFYKECEPFNIINLSELPPKKFIHTKLKLHLRLYILFTLPIMVGYCIFQIQTAWAALIIFVLLLINLSLFIVSKYAIYKPTKILSANNSLITVIHMCMIIPVIGQFLFPVPLLMSIRAYRKSLHNLKQYLDAYH